MLPRAAGPLYQRVAQLEVEEKGQWGGKDAKPQPPRAHFTEECLLRVYRSLVG